VASTETASTMPAASTVPTASGKGRL
jgi:hypothetical protein